MATHKSVARQLVDQVVEFDGKIFSEDLVMKLMSHTEEFKRISKARSTGTSNQSIYFRTSGGFRCAAKYGDAFQSVKREVCRQTRKLMIDELTAQDKDASEAACHAIRGWALETTSRINNLFTNAVALHVDAWDDFDLDGRLMGGDDVILDTSQGEVLVRACEHKDHVSYNVGYEIGSVLTNQATDEYREFKEKLLRIIKVPGHRDCLLPLVSAVVLNGHVAWLLKLIMAVCGPKDSAKSTLFMYVLAALGDDYGGTLAFNELTSGQATGSCNDAAMRRYLNLKRFCLVDEGEEEDSGRAYGRKRLLQSRIKSFMSNTPKKSRGAHTLTYTDTSKFPFFCITLNQSNMFDKPQNTDDLERWLLINATSLSKFKTGVVDDADAHVYAKDPEFVKPETIKKNRLHMLSLLCEYYNAGFDAEKSIPDDLKRIRDEWDYRYDLAESRPTAEVDHGPPAPCYVVMDGTAQTPEEALCDLVKRVGDMCKPAQNKLVTLKVRSQNSTPRSGEP